MHKVRTAIGRSIGQPPDSQPPVYFNSIELTLDQRIAAFREALEALAGKVYVAADGASARAYVEGTIAGSTAVASNSSYLSACGIRALPGVVSGITARDELTEICASARYGITSADYALADTGTLVMIASPVEQRLVSLLPPVHIAVVPCSSLLTGLDELLQLVPDPGQITSSMVLITGPSRTADIEQILVRGVHGPGEIHVVLVET
jgi:L-lactate dehydrogenase complex protein LldG